LWENIWECGLSQRLQICTRQKEKNGPIEESICDAKRYRQPLQYNDYVISFKNMSFKEYLYSAPSM